jgi:anti-sigma regulatory factor (Ser/Thr protein kinase)
MTDGFTVRLANDTPAIHHLVDLVEAFFARNHLPAAAAHTFGLAFDEVLTNIVSYAHPVPGRHEIEVSVLLDDGEVTAEVVDDGKPFDPLHEARDPDTTLSVEDRPIGGLGVFLVKRLMDRVEYRRADDKNHLTFAKRVATGAQPES